MKTFNPLSSMLAILLLTSAGATLAQDVEKHLAATGLVNAKQGVQARLKTPGPEAFSVVFMPRLVNMDGRLVRQGVQQFIERGCQGIGDLSDHVSKVPTRHSSRSSSHPILRRAIRSAT